jgi:hypothetical protein
MTEDRRVVWISHRGDERCTGCHVELFRGSFIQIARETGIRCLRCAGLADLAFLPSGDPALTRRAVAASSRSAIVVKFSRTRKRNERQGVLVEEAAIAAAQQQNAEDAARREVARGRRRIRDEATDREYIARFADRILEFFPSCPQHEAESIAQHACQKHSGRIGRTSAAKEFAERAITLAVRAHIRHAHTAYEKLLAKGLEPAEARPEVAHQIAEVLYRWQESPGLGRSSGPNEFG